MTSQVNDKVKATLHYLTSEVLTKMTTLASENRELCCVADLEELSYYQNNATVGIPLLNLNVVNHKTFDLLDNILGKDYYELETREAIRERGHVYELRVPINLAEQKQRANTGEVKTRRRTQSVGPGDRPLGGYTSYYEQKQSRGCIRVYKVELLLTLALCLCGISFYLFVTDTIPSGEDFQELFDQIAATWKHLLTQANLSVNLSAPPMQEGLTPPDGL